MGGGTFSGAMLNFGEYHFCLVCMSKQPLVLAMAPWHVFRKLSGTQVIQPRFDLLIP